MKENDKLIDAVIDLAQEMKGMRKDVNARLENLEKQQARTNMELAEIRLTFIQYADAIEKVIDHEKRIIRLENSTFNKKVSMVKEPKAVYKKKKK